MSSNGAAFDCFRLRSPENEKRLLIRPDPEEDLGRVLHQEVLVIKPQLIGCSTIHDSLIRY